MRRGVIENICFCDGEVIGIGKSESKEGSTIDFKRDIN